MNINSIHAELSLAPYKSYDVIIINQLVHVAARSRSAAKYKAFEELDMSEYITYAEFIKDKAYQVRTHCTGLSTLKDLFKDDSTLDYCRTYRKMPWLTLGMKIEWCGLIAYIVGGSDILLFYLPDEDRVVCDHPTYRITYYDDCDRIIARYNA